MSPDRSIDSTASFLLACLLYQTIVKLHFATTEVRTCPDEDSSIIKATTSPNFFLKSVTSVNQPIIIGESSFVAKTITDVIVTIIAN